MENYYSIILNSILWKRISFQSLEKQYHLSTKNFHVSGEYVSVSLRAPLEDIGHVVWLITFYNLQKANVICDTICKLWNINHTSIWWIDGSLYFRLVSFNKFVALDCGIRQHGRPSVCWKLVDIGGWKPKIDRVQNILILTKYCCIFSKVIFIICCFTNNAY